MRDPVRCRHTLGWAKQTILEHSSIRNLLVTPQEVMPAPSSCPAQEWRVIRQALRPTEGSHTGKQW